MNMEKIDAWADETIESIADDIPDFIIGFDESYNDEDYTAIIPITKDQLKKDSFLYNYLQHGMIGQN